MSHVVVDGKPERVSLAELIEIDELAAEKKITREEAAKLKMKKPAAKKRGATKKKEG